MRKIGAAVTIAVLVLFCVTIAGTSQAVSTGGQYPKSTIEPQGIDFYRPPITTENYPLTRARRVRNVIFCIGDGMGLNQVALARLKAAGPKGKLYMEKMPVTGFTGPRRGIPARPCLSMRWVPVRRLSRACATIRKSPGSHEFVIRIHPTDEDGP